MAGPRRKYSPKSSSRPLDLRIRPLNLASCVHLTEPLLDQGVLLKRQPCETVLAHPRLKMVVYHCDLSRQHAATITLPELALEHFVAPIGLFGVPIQGIFILVRVIVTSEYSQYPYSTRRIMQLLAETNWSAPSWAPGWSGGSIPTCPGPHAPALSRLRGPADSSCHTRVGCS